MTRLFAAALAILVAAILAAFVLGLFLGRVVDATPPSAPDPEPSWSPVLTEVPQPPWVGLASPATVGSAGASADAGPGDVLPSPETVVAVPAATPGRSITVTATFYCNADLSRYRASACRKGYPDRLGVDDLFAAVSADLAWLDGKTFTAWYRGRSVIVRAVDRCDCGSHKLDLYLDAWLHLASIATGRLYGVAIR